MSSLVDQIGIGRRDYPPFALTEEEESVFDIVLKSIDAKNRYYEHRFMVNSSII